MGLKKQKQQVSFVSIHPVTGKQDYGVVTFDVFGIDTLGRVWHKYKSIGDGDKPATWKLTEFSETRKFEWNDQA